MLKINNSSIRAVMTWKPTKKNSEIGQEKGDWEDS